MANTKPLASQIRYGRNNATTIDSLLKNSIITYVSKTEAVSFAVNLPDGQIVDVIDVQERYTVQNGVLVFNGSLYKGLNPSASIKHVRDGVFIYDVATIVAPAKSMTIYTLQSDPESPIMTRKNVLEFAQNLGVPIACNCVPFRNADGSAGAENSTLVPDGILITNNRVVAGRESALDPNRNQACALMPDGTLTRFRKSTHTAQQIADAGAIWAFSWGAWCLWDGVVPPDYATSPLGGGTIPSGRTIIGQRVNGEIVIVTVQGVTGSSGATPAQCSQLAIDNGMIRAFVGDGGGSTQMVWGGAFATPSSDLTFRTLPAILGIRVMSPAPYDSGIITIPAATWITGPISSLLPAISLRQIGADVRLTFNASGFSNNTSPFAAGELIPHRYRPETSSQGRGVGIGLGGGLFTWTMGQDSVSQKPNGILTVGTVTGLATTPTGLGGQISWTQRRT